MASAELARRVEKVVGYPPLCEMSDQRCREFYEALLAVVVAIRVASAASCSRPARLAGAGPCSSST
jgi:hypothetical protein